MIRIILTIVLFVLPLCLFPQKKYLETGTEWFYNIQEFHEFRDYGYRHYKVIGDSLVEGQLCKVVSHVAYRHSGEVVVFDPLLFRIDGGKIDIWEHDKFLAVYNFDLNKGDTLFHSLYNYQQCDSLSALIIDSVQTIVVDGRELKKQFASQTIYYNREIRNRIGKIHYIFYERIGYLESFVFRPRCDVADSFGANWSLRCYTDSDIHFKNSWWKTDQCDVIVTNVERVGKSHEISAYPTYVKDLLHLSADIPSEFEAMIIGLNGSTFLQRTGRFPGILDISSLQKGFYVLKVIINNDVHIFKIYKS